MSKNKHASRVTPRELTRGMTTLGFVFVRHGRRHVVYRHERTGDLVSIPQQGSAQRRQLPRYILRAVANACGFTIREVENTCKRGRIAT